MTNRPAPEYGLTRVTVSDPDPAASATTVPSTVIWTPVLGQFPKCRCTECTEPEARPMAWTCSRYAPAIGVMVTCPLTASATDIKGNCRGAGAAATGAGGTRTGGCGAGGATVGEGEGDALGAIIGWLGAPVPGVGERAGAGCAAASGPQPAASSAARISGRRHSVRKTPHE